MMQELMANIKSHVSLQHCSSLAQLLLLFPVVLQMTEDPVDSDPLVFWRTVLKSVGSTAIKSSVQYILGVQWAIWLATCQLKTIQEFQVQSCLQAVFTVDLFGVLHLSIQSSLFRVITWLSFSQTKQLDSLSLQVNSTMVCLQCNQPEGYVMCLMYL